MPIPNYRIPFFSTGSGLPVTSSPDCSACDEVGFSCPGRCSGVSNVAGVESGGKYILYQNFFFSSFFKGFASPFLREAQTCKKESFFVYGDDTDSMNDDVK